jgi:hypothetical protein
MAYTLVELIQIAIFYMDPMNHDDKGMHPHHPPHMMGGWKSSWKSPVGLGFFLLTASIALAIFLNYILLTIIGTIMQLSHPATSQGMTAAEMQQLQQSAYVASATR